MNTSVSTRIRRQCLAVLLVLVAPVLWASDPITTWGAVVDTRAPDPAGLRVMAVTPGSTAEKIGVRAGDRLVSANGVKVSTASNPSQALQGALSSGRGLRLSLLRGGQPVTLTGQLTNSPAGGAVLEGCGYVTNQGPTPHVTRKIYPVEITQIDGESTPLSPVNRHRVDGGKRVLVVREMIDPNQFTNVQHRDREREHRRQRGGFYKTLLVDVAPDTQYSIGARLVKGRGQATRQDFIDKTYWEPVVWQERAEDCR